MGGASIQIVLILTMVISRRKNQWYIVSVTLEQNIWQVWSLVFLPTKLSLFKNNIHQSKSYKNHFEISNFWGMWPLGHVGHVTYSFINMLFISMVILYDKLPPQILSVGTTTNSPLNTTKYLFHRYVLFVVVAILSFFPLLWLVTRFKKKELHDWYH